MKIYTKTGDQGETSLWGGTRVPKDHLRIEAYGTVDELNSWLGYLSTCSGFEDDGFLIHQIQQDLFTIGSILAADPEKKSLKLPELRGDAIEQLEFRIDKLDAELPALKNFILSGGHPSNAIAHIARTICRRAERCVVALGHHETLPPHVLTYLNRLSDLLFQMARNQSQLHNAPEIPWIYKEG
jgi:cob(I)alamin adenosyltransferase